MITPIAGLRKGFAIFSGIAIELKNNPLSHRLRDASSPEGRAFRREGKVSGITKKAPHLGGAAERSEAERVQNGEPSQAFLCWGYD